MTPEWKIIRNCEYCNKEFMPSMKKNIYCNRICKNLDKKNRGSIEINCITCGKPFRTIRSYIEKKNIINCSRVCSAKWRIGKSVSKETREKLSRSKNKENNPNWKGGKPICLICKNECSRRGVNYCWNCLVDNNILKDLVPQGEKHYRWDGGGEQYKELNKLRGSTKYRKIRKQALERDNFICLNCGSKENLEVDHILPVCNYPELLFDLENLRTLCYDCHVKTDTFGGKICRKK